MRKPPSRRENQRYEAMLEQVQVRRSEVSQKLLKIKSDESVQDEQIENQQVEIGRAKEKLETLKSAQAESESQQTLLEKSCRKLRQSLSEAQQEQKIASAKLDSRETLQSAMRAMEAVHGV